MENVVFKLPKPSNNFWIQSVNNKKCHLMERLLFVKMESDKVFKILRNFYEHKARGLDISGIFLEDGASLLATPIRQLCNLSISSGRFRDAYKVAKLRPLFRKGSTMDLKNYRPISLLRLISKALERMAHEQTMDFLGKTQCFMQISIRISKKSFYRLLLVLFNW